MRLPLKYHWRHLRVRWRSSLGTMACIGLVVAVFVMVMALARGLASTFVTTGDPHNLLVIRKGALAESSSQITADHVRRTRSLDGIQRTQEGEPLASAEMIVLITLPRRSGGLAHVQVRGLGPLGLQLRPYVKLVEGRMFQPGQRECIVSRKLAKRFEHCRLGEGFRAGKGDWKVVGVFDAQKSAFESEIWMDVDESREAFNRSFYCSIAIRPESDAAARTLRDTIEGDRQTRLRAFTETEYYRDQIKTARPLQIFGMCLAGIMSVGASFAAMNTMYASIGRRVREIGTLRVLGFRRRSIYVSFIIEALMVAAAGGVLGCALSLPLHGIATGTFNWATFAEVAFEFRITPQLMGWGMLFALLMGLLGALLPARFAARKPILEALRE